MSLPGTPENVVNFFLFLNTLLSPEVLEGNGY